MSETLVKPETITFFAEEPTSGPQGEPVIYELGAPGRRGYALPALDVPGEEALGDLLPGVPLRDELRADRAGLLPAPGGDQPGRGDRAGLLARHQSGHRRPLWLPDREHPLQR